VERTKCSKKKKERACSLISHAVSISVTSCEPKGIRPIEEGLWKMKPCSNEILFREKKKGKKKGKMNQLGGRWIQSEDCRPKRWRRAQSVKLVGGGKIRRKWKSLL